MKILVTGAGGFLGGHLARGLAADGYEIYALGRSQQPIPPDDRAAAARFQVVNARLDRDELDLDVDVDAVVHAAATSPWSGVSAGDLVRDNVDATRMLLSLAQRAGVRRFIFFSSLSAYGRIETATVDENTPSHEADVYGLTKLLGERMVEEMIPQARSLSIRLPGVVGKGAARHWLAVTLERLRAGAPVSYFNPLQLFNNIVHESDLGRLVVGFLGSEGEPEHDAVVVASTGFMTVEKVIQRLVAMTDSRSQLICEGVRSGSFTVDFSKAERMYGFAPLSIEAALDRYLEEETGFSRERR